LLRELLALILLFTAAGGCGLSATNDRLTYDELDTKEKAAVGVILKELKAFNSQVKRLTKHDIDNIIDKEKIDVSYEGMLFVANLGDNIIHMSVWENLEPAQQELVRQWFSAKNLTTARAWYQKFFYQFLGVTQGVKQYMFNVLTPQWVFARRTVFNIERDAIRNAMSFYKEKEKSNPVMWPFLKSRCKPVIKQYASRYPGTFPDIKKSKAFLQDHFMEMSNPDNPTGYMYFICKWIELGEATTDLNEELQWLEDLPK